ncbi:hypothetical protein [Spirillospora sp. CA-294931]|uniref:hypothetical protein n=1 Tax=Spirillospora sp. CA-294931 TaxID=3240042 RepID=UPI003D8E05C8
MTRGKWIIVAVCYTVAAAGFGGVGVATTYTMLWGERTTAYVNECHLERTQKNKTNYREVCNATWQTKAGEQKDSTIEGVGPADVHKHVKVRLGPAGDAYAGSYSDHGIVYAPFILAVPPVIAGVVWWRRRGRVEKVEPLV